VRHCTGVFTLNPDDTNKKTVIVKPFCIFSFSHSGRRQSSSTSHIAHISAQNASEKSATVQFLTPSPLLLLLGGLLGEGEGEGEASSASRLFTPCLLLANSENIENVD
jgi:hypothetical protein